MYLTGHFVKAETSSCTIMTALSSVYLNSSSDFSTAGANTFTCKTKADLFAGGHNNQSTCHSSSKCSFTILWPVAIRIMACASRSLGSCSNHNSVSNQSQPSLATFCLLLSKVTLKQQDTTFSGDHPWDLSADVDAASSQHLPLHFPIDFSLALPLLIQLGAVWGRQPCLWEEGNPLTVRAAFWMAPENTELLWSAVRELTKLIEEVTKLRLRWFICRRSQIFPYSTDSPSMMPADLVDIPTNFY